METHITSFNTNKKINGSVYVKESRQLYSGIAEYPADLLWNETSVELELSSSSSSIS